MIGNCDCCDRRDVPGSVVDVPGEPFACHICQGDIADPYCEIDERTEACSACGGDGGWDRDGYGAGYWQTCTDCVGTGHEIIQVQPVTLHDLDQMEPEHVA